MAEKTTFSQLLPDAAPQVPPDAKACANCAHARIDMNAQVVRKVVTCKALPKFPVCIPSPQGMGIRFFHPTMELFEECDLFELKITPADGISGDSGVG